MRLHRNEENTRYRADLLSEPARCRVQDEHSGGAALASLNLQRATLPKVCSLGRSSRCPRHSREDAVEREREKEQHVPIGAGYSIVADLRPPGPGDDSRIADALRQRPGTICAESSPPGFGLAGAVSASAATASAIPAVSA